MKKIILVLGMFFLFSVNAQADSNETGKITEIIAQGTEYISIWLDGSNDKTDCTGGDRWTLKSDDLLFKEKLSLLMTAAASGKTIQLTGLSSLGCGNWNSNKVFLVKVVF